MRPAIWVINFRVDKDKIQEKLIAIGDSTNSNPVLADTLVRSVVCDNTLIVTLANIVTNLAADKGNMQEQLTAGEVPSESQISAVLDDNIIKVLVGNRGISLQVLTS